jgi:hypothetical protein
MTAACSLFAPSDRELMGDSVDAALDDAECSRDSSRDSCADGAGCLVVGSVCSIDTDCCGLACHNSVCCVQQGSSCNSDGQCCYGSCYSGQCHGSN